MAKKNSFDLHGTRNEIKRIHWIRVARQTSNQGKTLESEVKSNQSNTHIFFWMNE